MGTPANALCSGMVGLGVAVLIPGCVLTLLIPVAPTSPRFAFRELLDALLLRIGGALRDGEGWLTIRAEDS